MFRNKNFLLTVILPILCSIIIGIIIILLNSTSVLNTRASSNVAKEKKEMSDEIEVLASKKKELTLDASNYDSEIENNRILLNEIEALKSELDGYTSSIELANATIIELDQEISDKTKYNESLNNVTTQNSGASVVYTDKKLNVPQDITTGRYKAEGTGKLYIYNIAGALEVSRDLSVTDTHSYTFDLYSGQYIKIQGTLTLTNISN